LSWFELGGTELLLELRSFNFSVLPRGFASAAAELPVAAVAGQV